MQKADDRQGEQELRCCETALESLTFAPGPGVRVIQGPVKFGRLRRALKAGLDGLQACAGWALTWVQNQARLHGGTAMAHLRNGISMTDHPTGPP